MGLTLSAPIATARGILNDRRADTIRYSNADLLGYGNDALDELVRLLPHLFHTEGEVECTPAKCLQSLPYDGAVAVVNVTGIKGGGAVLPADRSSLDAFNPAWQQDAAGAAVNWMPVANDPMRFFIYPQAPVDQVLNVIYVKVPDEYTENQDTGLPTTLSPGIADYIVSRAEARDDEHINSNRAAQFLAAFVGRFSPAA